MSYTCAVQYSGRERDEYLTVDLPTDIGIAGEETRRSCVYPSVSNHDKQRQYPRNRATPNLRTLGAKRLTGPTAPTVLGPRRRHHPVSCNKENHQNKIVIGGETQQTLTRTKNSLYYIPGIYHTDFKGDCIPHTRSDAKLTAERVFATNRTKTKSKKATLKLLQ